MSTHKEREKILRYWYGEKLQLLTLNFEVKDEVVPDPVHLSGQQENYYKIQIGRSSDWVIVFLLKVEGDYQDLTMSLSWKLVKANLYLKTQE